MYIYVGVLVQMADVLSLQFLVGQVQMRFPSMSSTSLLGFTFAVLALLCAVTAQTLNPV